jgi:hypothetical protein
MRTPGIIAVHVICHTTLFGLKEQRDCNRVDATYTRETGHSVSNAFISDRWQFQNGEGICRGDNLLRRDMASVMLVNAGASLLLPRL